MMHNKSTFPATVGLIRDLRRADSRRRWHEGLIHRLVEGLLLFLIQIYRWIFSPAQIFLFGGDSGCRFTPTCSQYAAEAIRHHGAVGGGILAFKRICRCHPLGGCGFDPVPQGDDGGQCRKERGG
jgi:uncharacterized protein